MSRIGKLPISIPQGVKINVTDKNVVTVKGPMGELSQSVDPCITVNVNDDSIVLERHTEQLRHKSLHGTYRALLANMVKGVSTGFRVEHELVGVGYRATANGNVLDLSLGYSHNVIFELPTDIKIETTAVKGKNPTIILVGKDKQLLGQISAKLRSLRKPEPYKGKGIKFLNEQIRRKAGKSAGK
ncbi:MAG: 50S ribosomal protein L6 [Bacteroidota bacterium]|nr:50S ribosomal protein L6 [Bacteroidota bacterium]